MGMNKLPQSKVVNKKVGTWYVELKDGKHKLSELEERCKTCDFKKQCFLFNKVAWLYIDDLGNIRCEKQDD